MSPGEVLDRHTSLELTEWAAYFQLEKIDQDKTQQTARVKAQVAKARSGKR